MLAETLLESELFGHEKGSFTGAVGRRGGRFQQADGGTLFLDEIGEISSAIQIKLLRFLQERTFERVGSNDTVTVDVRVVAATNRDLERLVEQGKFREDLFYRLKVVAIDMPPLRARPSDIPLLAVHFLRKYAEREGRDVRRFSDQALERLCAHNWPGNIRELQNVVERAIVVCGSDEITTRDLPAEIAGTGAPVGNVPIIPGATLKDLERHAILETLKSTGGSTRDAARILGISPRTIQYRLHEYATQSVEP